MYCRILSDRDETLFHVVAEDDRPARESWTVRDQLAECMCR